MAFIGEAHGQRGPADDLMLIRSKERRRKKQSPNIPFMETPLIT